MVLKQKSGNSIPDSFIALFHHALLDHGRVGHCHGCKGATAVVGRHCWHVGIRSPSFPVQNQVLATRLDKLWHLDGRCVGLLGLVFNQRVAQLLFQPTWYILHMKLAPIVSSNTALAHHLQNLAIHLECTEVRQGVVDLAESKQLSVQLW